MKLAVIAFLLFFRAMPGNAAQYGVVRSAAPVLNTPTFNTVFGGMNARSLKTDRCGQVRELEFIALPGTVFRLLAEQRQGARVVYRVETEEYPLPPSTGLYVESSFIELRDGQPPARRRVLPERAAIVAGLRAALGSPYVWGGNLSQGVRELLGTFYRGTFTAEEEKRLTLAGLDCSGLLYQATGGWTPRNTSSLVSFGRGIPVAGRSAAELAGLLEPLDLIVWSGHVIIVLDRKTVIESRLVCGRPGNGGVKCTPLQERLAKLMRTRRPVDAWPEDGKPRDTFVVRRWYGQ